MSPALRILLAFWAALWVAVICFVFLPLAKMQSLLLLSTGWLIILLLWGYFQRQVPAQQLPWLQDLPAPGYRQPVVIICGDFPQAWPQESPILLQPQGCWIRIAENQDVEQAGLQLLAARPQWGDQLSVMVNVCPQQHVDAAVFSHWLLSVRWYISQLRKRSGYPVPLILTTLVGCQLTHDSVWQLADCGEGGRVRLPLPIASTDSQATPEMAQQVLLNGLIRWSETDVCKQLSDEKPDLPPVYPAVQVWGLSPLLAGSFASGLWNHWLTDRTALSGVSGWQPSGTDSTLLSLLPDFIFPILPHGQGMTPVGRASRSGLALLFVAVIAALLSSGWNNRQLLIRLNSDLNRYQQLPREDYVAKAREVDVLRQDIAQLDSYRRNGVPLRLSLGLYRGEYLRVPLLDTVSRYQPPPPPAAAPIPVAPPEIIRLDSLSLFDSGRADLKTDSVPILVRALTGINAKPGWLILISGHTDNTGDPQRNQTLSLQRAEAVRNWMRDIGQVPESCFAVQGYGESRPLQSNTTPQGRASNRRVEISLVPQANACQRPDTPPALSKDDNASQHNGEY